MQDVAPPCEYVPAEHVAHEVDPDPLANVPDWHATQFPEEDEGFEVPGSQGIRHAEPTVLQGALQPAYVVHPQPEYWSQ